MRPRQRPDLNRAVFFASDNTATVGTPVERIDQLVAVGQRNQGLLVGDIPDNDSAKTVTGNDLFFIGSNGDRKNIA